MLGNMCNRRGGSWAAASPAMRCQHVWPFSAGGGARHPTRPGAHLADAQLAQELAGLPGKGLVTGGAVAAPLQQKRDSAVSAAAEATDRPAGGGGWARQAAIAPAVRSPEPAPLRDRQGQACKAARAATRLCTGPGHLAQPRRGLPPPSPALAPPPTPG